jgi:hypothetical protein
LTREGASSGMPAFRASAFYARLLHVFPGMQHALAVPSLSILALPASTAHSALTCHVSTCPLGCFAQSPAPAIVLDDIERLLEHVAVTIY